MILHRDRRDGRVRPGVMPTSAYELGRSLRRIRTRQGFHTEDVSARTGLPLDQLEALESGVFDRVPDRMAMLRTLRRYADFLGLPGDRYVLVLVDHWPAPAAPSGPQPRIVAVDPVPGAGLDHPGSYDVGTARVSAVSTSTVAGKEPASAYDDQATGVLPLSAPTGGGWDTRNATAPVALHAADTGVIAAVPPRAAGAGRRARPPLGLRVVVGLVALAVLAGVGGLLVHHFDPRVLSSLGITRGTPTASTAGSGAGTATTGGTGGAASGGTAIFTVTTTSPGAATFEVRAPIFLVHVIAVGNESWMQATGPPTGATSAAAAPGGTVLFSGLLTSGQSKDFFVQRTLSVEVGSVAAHVYVSVGKKTVGFYYPPAAPYTMTFNALST